VTVLLPPVLELPPLADDPAELEALLVDAPPEAPAKLLLALTAPPEDCALPAPESPPSDEIPPPVPSSEQPAPNAANVDVMMPMSTFDREYMVWLLCPKPQADS